MTNLSEDFYLLPTDTYDKEVLMYRQQKLKRQK